MKSSQLEFPIGIHVWNKELRKHRSQLVEGYTFAPLEETSDSYRFTIAASPDNVEKIIHTFCRGQFDEAFLILEYYRNEQPVSQGEPNVPDVYYSPYLPSGEILDHLQPYMQRLLHDGFVGFGLANNRAGMEIFYSEEKLITCFTDNHIRTMDMLNSLGIRHQPDMLFHTDLGHDHLSLLCHPRNSLPDMFAGLGTPDLDFVKFCSELADELGMYPVEETITFFLTRREQDLIEDALGRHPDYNRYAAEDFGGILLDWNDFVTECEAGFEGDLEDYRTGLHLRDVIDYIIEVCNAEVAEKIREIVAEPDEKFRKILTDCRKRLDRHMPAAPNTPIPFWYQGVVGKPGVNLRRDLIRQGWFNPHG